MKRIVTLVLTLALCGAMCTDAMANRRDNGNGKGNRREQVPTQKNSGSGYSRPGTRSKSGTGYNRPGNGNNGSHKPGNGAVRPGNGHWGNNHKPAPNPGHGNYPGMRPAPHRPGTSRPPMHAGFRPGGNWHRPMPPRGWRPGRRVPAFRSILGVNFGLSLALSLQSLRASNCMVRGYDGNEVYLTNVPMQGYYWPSATMFYSNGGLVGSQFVYTSNGYDMARYNGVYNSLYNAYGAPVVTNGTQVTWFGGNNEYITLNFMPVVAGGASHFCTTLSFGI